MKLYHDGAGNALGLYDDDAPAHPGAAGSVQFDAATNQALLDSLGGRVAGFTWQDHKVAAGAVQRKGVALTVAADHPATTDARQVKQNAAVLFAALRAGTATNAQVQRVLAFLLRQFLQG